MIINLVMNNFRYHYTQLILTVNNKNFNTLEIKRHFISYTAIETMYLFYKFSRVYSYNGRSMWRSDIIASLCASNTSIK